MKLDHLFLDETLLMEELVLHEQEKDGVHSHDEKDQGKRFARCIGTQQRRGNIANHERP